MMGKNMHRVAREFQPVYENYQGKRFLRTGRGGICSLGFTGHEDRQPSEVQQVFIDTQQKDLCTICTLRNLAEVVPAGVPDLLFLWRDAKSIETYHGAGEPFRIGGASFYPAQGAVLDTVRLVRKWKSTIYEAYIRAFERIASAPYGRVASPGQPAYILIAIELAARQFFIQALMEARHAEAGQLESTGTPSSSHPGGT
ncbi:hypothetical protein BD779DRAFT_1782825 [Infundibulicybe gibba]|nr:hypothetical protein BD779DRAFT_1782825 [Infundibulicybe gibba]